MPPTDRTPLLEDGNGRDASASFYKRFIDFVKATDEPSWTDSYKYFLVSWFNILLIFIPLGFLSHHLHWDATLRFVFNFMAIIPLAKLLGEATEQMSAELGQTLAGLLNATFGNAVEIIVGVAALLQGELRIVQTSMLGSILSNLLLVLGCSFLAGGVVQSESHFQTTAAQNSGSLMALSCITLVIPAAYNNAKHRGSPPFGNNAVGEIAPGQPFSSSDGLLFISRGTAVLLLSVYVAYLYFQLKTHNYLFQAAEEEDGEPARMSTVAAGSALLIVTITTSFCADYLVASIEETADRYQIPKAFIGLILLPIVANAAEHVTAIWMAAKNKMEITIGVSVGSSIQIVSFVIPLLVIVGWVTGHNLTLHFEDLETIVLFLSVFLFCLLIQDGKSNYMEGIMLITLYLVIALAFWVS